MTILIVIMVVIIALVLFTVHREQTLNIYGFSEEELEERKVELNKFIEKLRESNIDTVVPIENTIPNKYKLQFIDNNLNVRYTTEIYRRDLSVDDVKIALIKRYNNINKYKNILLEKQEKILKDDERKIYEILIERIDILLEKLEKDNV